MRQFIDIIAKPALLEAKEGEWVGVQRSEIPPQFAGKKVIGQGVTSIVLDNGDGTITMLTRDTLKAEWLEHLGIAKKIGQFQSDGHKIPKFATLPIMIYTMPKLMKLSPENKKVVRKAVTAFRQINHKFMTHDQRRGFIMSPAGQAALVKHFGELEGHLLSELIKFVGKRKPDPESFNFDLATQNFMQKEDGTIVVLDPVVTKKIMRFMDGFRFTASYDENGERLDGGPRSG